MTGAWSITIQGVGSHSTDSYTDADADFRELVAQLESHGQHIVYARFDHSDIETAEELAARRKLAFNAELIGVNEPEAAQNKKEKRQ